MVSVVLGSGCVKQPSVQVVADNAVPTSTYHDDTLGFSVDSPKTVIMSDCSQHTTEGNTYALVDKRTAVPLLRTKISQGVVFHPEWLNEPFGETSSHMLAGCRRVSIDGKSVAHREIYKDFPYWMISAETLSSENGIQRSIEGHCRQKWIAPARYTGLTTTTQPGVFTVGVETDPSKSDDSSAVFCTDLISIRYIPSTKKIFYLFHNGLDYENDPSNQLITETLRFDSHE